MDWSYSKYLAKHGKSYKSKAEYSLRKALFEASIAKIDKHNSMNHTWFKAVNQFADMTKEEIN